MMGDNRIGMGRRMNVKLSQYSNQGDSNYAVQDKVICTLNGAEVEVRQSDDGTHMVVAIRNGSDNQIAMQSRAAAIWIAVK